MQKIAVALAGGGRLFAAPKPASCRTWTRSYPLSSSRFVAGGRVGTWHLHAFVSPFPSHRRLSTSTRSASDDSDPARSTAPVNENLLNDPFLVIFMGSDTFSCEILRSLHKARSGLVEDFWVVAPKARRMGRGLKEIHVPPLVQLAEELGLQHAIGGVDAVDLPKLFPSKWRIEMVPKILLITASFPFLIPNSMLNRFIPQNCLNVHPSLLPKYRGAAPVQKAIMDGVDKTGVTIQTMSPNKFDAGDLLAQSEVELHSGATYEELLPVLAKSAGELLVDVLQNWKERHANAWSQDPTQVSWAPKINKEDARVKWFRQSALQLIRLQRAIGQSRPLFTELTPPPNATRDDRPLVPTRCQIRLSQIPAIGDIESTAPLELSSPGSLHIVKKKDSHKLFVQCTDQDFVEVVEILPSGAKGWSSAYAWAREKSSGLKEGEILRFQDESIDEKKVTP